MKTNKNYIAPQMEQYEVVVEQGIALSDPTIIDLTIDGFGGEQSWD